MVLHNFLHSRPKLIFKCFAEHVFRQHLFHAYLVFLGLQVYNHLLDNTFAYTKEHFVKM